MVGRQLKAAVEVAEGKFGTALQWVVRGPRRASTVVLRPSEGDLVDDLAALRHGLTPNAERQVELPLLYRRIFGRAALENPTCCAAGTWRSLG